MKTRRFGRTDLQVSELVFGGGWVGGLLIDQDDETRRTAIQQALQGGINFIDTAPSYGQGASEQALGWLLKEVDQQPYISTKFEIDPNKLDDIAGQIEHSLEASLKRLQRDSVDLLQMHNRIEAQPSGRGLAIETILGRDGVADSLDRLREQGLFNYMGITALGDTDCCVDVINSRRFDSAQVYYNLLNPSADQSVPTNWSSHNFAGLIAACKNNDVAVMNIRVFAAGVIATDVRHGREVPVSKAFDIAAEEKRAKAVFELLDERYGTRAQTAIRFALANTDISCVIFGLAQLEHLEQALAAAEMGPLPQEALTRLQALYTGDFATI